MEITQELIDTYTKGECHYLAQALSEITGWPIVTIGYGKHWAVRTPSGLLLDITGLSTDEEMSAKWDTTTITIPDEDDWTFLWENQEDDYRRAYLRGEENDAPSRARQVARYTLDVYAF